MTIGFDKSTSAVLMDTISLAKAIFLAPSAMFFGMLLYGYWLQCQGMSYDFKKMDRIDREGIIFFHNAAKQKKQKAFPVIIAKKSLKS